MNNTDDGPSDLNRLQVPSPASARPSRPVGRVRGPVQCIASLPNLPHASPHPVRESTSKGPRRLPACSAMMVPRIMPVPSSGSVDDSQRSALPGPSCRNGTPFRRPTPSWSVVEGLRATRIAWLRSAPRQRPFPSSSTGRKRSTASDECLLCRSRTIPSVILPVDLGFGAIAVNKWRYRQTNV